MTKTTHPSRTVEQIEEQIHNLYNYAKQNQDKEFLVAYSGTGSNLNAYSNQEMADMFSSEQIPSNIVFSESFAKLLNPKSEVTTKGSTVETQGDSTQNLVVTNDEGLKQMAIFTRREQLNELIQQRPDIDAEAATNTFNDIVEQYSKADSDSMNNALMQLLCGL